MRRLLLLLVFPILAEAQNINRVEYFWDTDPGPGNGTPLAIAPAPSLTLTPTIPLNSIAEGFHVLYFRSRSAGKWSLPLARAVYVQRGAQITTASLISRLEYFADSDPGPCNGVSVPITAAATVSHNFTMSLGALPEGFHLICFRARTANNQWSPPLCRPVFVQRNAQTAASPAMRQLEYFFDTDPGTGNGTNIPLTLSAENQSIVVDLTGVAPGFHILYIRAEDNNGRWSGIISVPFLAEYSGDNIVALEYFFTDGTTTTPIRMYSGFTPGSNLTIDFAAALTGLAPNTLYNIHVLGRNARGQYSTAAIHAFTTPTVLCDPLSPPATISASGCAPGTVDLQASGAGAGQSYLWYDLATGGTPLTGATGGTFTTPVLTSSTTYYAVVLNGTCESARTPANATVIACGSPPVFNSATVTTPAGSTLVFPMLPLISDPDNDLDTASIQVVTPPLSEAPASMVNGILTINYSGVNFAGPDSLTVQACDLVGNCVQQVLYVEVVGDLVIYTAVSPNNDGKNDTFVIQNIEFFPETRENKLTLFNRWGSVVFEATNYDNTTNVFAGKGKDGQDLPSGTYYYVLEFTNGDPKRTGFISLRK